MSFEEHAADFAGLPVVDVTVDHRHNIELPAVADPGAVAWRIRVVEGYEFGDPVAEFGKLLEHFLGTVDSSRVTALVVGDWADHYSEDTESHPVPLVRDAADRLPNLRALFVGDIVREESDAAYIRQYDMTTLLDAYPLLEELTTRGGEGLVLPTRTYPNLRKLHVQAGGLGREVVRAIGASAFPRLTHLDIWLGVENYGGDASVADLARILDGTDLPALRHLGLVNSEIQDEIAEALGGAPIVGRLEELDLSHGTLGDEGAEALLGGQPLTHLRRFTAHHHFVGEPVRQRLLAALPGVEVDMPQALRRGDWGSGRYVAVSE
ncbi:STM4015 family protein [Streptodolium elevatio]|uniref:STM4015 family protein n=1 Tax=Streptodolium elevatio TaxID=3157996 RepID=A0ABV3DMC5_9ACTN